MILTILKCTIQGLQYIHNGVQPSPLSNSVTFSTPRKKLYPLAFVPHAPFAQPLGTTHLLPGFIFMVPGAYHLVILSVWVMNFSVGDEPSVSSCVIECLSPS